MVEEDFSLVVFLFIHAIFPHSPISLFFFFFVHPTLHTGRPRLARTDSYLRAAAAASHTREEA